MKAGEHGPDKIYQKFFVAKNKDVLYSATTGWYSIPEDRALTNGEFIFVLRPETDDQAALAALETYADVCEPTYPKLASQIRQQVARIRTQFPDGNPSLRSASGS